MGAIAQPDYAAWALRYPTLACAVNATLYASYFAEAGLYLNNTGASPVSDVGMQGILLNMLVAHIALLNGAAGGAAGAGLVGRITSATEGSVSVQVGGLGELPGTAAWFTQTGPGLQFYSATAPYRTMHYVPAPCDTFAGTVPYWPQGYLR